MLSLMGEYTANDECMCYFQAEKGRITILVTYVDGILIAGNY